MQTIRTFIAIELSPTLLAALKEQHQRARSALPGHNLRWVNPQGIHLTLKFLGDTPTDRVVAIQEALRRACEGVRPFEIGVGGLGCFPNLRRPAVLWISVHADRSLLALQNAVEQAISPLGFPAEKRPFSAHLTLARIDRAASEAELRPISNYIGKSSAEELGRMRVDSIHFIRSKLKPTGAVYTTLYVAPLENK